MREVTRFGPWSDVLQAATASYYFLLAQVSTSYGHSERSQTLRTSNQHLRHCACTRDTNLPSHMYCCTNSNTLVSAPATRDRYTAQRYLNQELLTNIGGALNIVDTPQGTPSDPQSITFTCAPPHSHTAWHTFTLPFTPIRSTLMVGELRVSGKQGL